MGSDAVAAEGARLLAGASALFLGLACACLLRSALRRGDGRSGRRAALAMVALSATVALAAWSALVLLRGRLEAGPLAWYALAGFLPGFVGGTFPRAAGLPLLAAASLAWLLASASVSGREPWSDGALAASLSVWSADGSGSLCGLSTAGREGAIVARNIRLGPGAIELRVESTVLRGPFSALLGHRFWRPVALAAGGKPVPLEEETPRTGFLSTIAGTVAPLLGMERTELASPPLEARPLASADILLDDESGLVLDPD